MFNQHGLFLFAPTFLLLYVLQCFGERLSTHSGPLFRRGGENRKERWVTRIWGRKERSWRRWKRRRRRQWWWWWRGWTYLWGRHRELTKKRSWRWRGGSRVEMSQWWNRSVGERRSHRGKRARLKCRRRSRKASRQGAAWRRGLRNRRRAVSRRRRRGRMTWKTKCDTANATASLNRRTRWIDRGRCWSRCSSISRRGGTNWMIETRRSRNCLSAIRTEWNHGNGRWLFTGWERNRWKNRNWSWGDDSGQGGQGASSSNRRSSIQLAYTVRWWCRRSWNLCRGHCRGKSSSRKTFQGETLQYYAHRNQHTATAQLENVKGTRMREKPTDKGNKKNCADQQVWS